MGDTTRVEITSKSLDLLAHRLAEKPADNNSMWTTLIPLLIGAALTLLTQLLIELYKTNKEKAAKKQELISKGRARMYLIAQILKDLSMYKVHKQYYLRGYAITTDAAEKEDSFKKHYEKGQEQRNTETRLDDNISEYFQIVSEYIIISKNKDDFQQLFDSIFHYTHPKSYKFADCNTEAELVKGLEKEELRLNEEYKKFFQIFETIQTEMV